MIAADVLKSGAIPPLQDVDPHDRPPAPALSARPFVR